MLVGAVRFAYVAGFTASLHGVHHAGAEVDGRALPVRLEPLAGGLAFLLVAKKKNETNPLSTTGTIASKKLAKILFKRLISKMEFNAKSFDVF